MFHNRIAKSALLLASSLFAGIAVNGAVAQTGYPVKPVRIIAPSSPGGGVDILARIVALKLYESLGRQVVVENRPGAGGMIGMEAVARSAADGYTLLLAGSAIVTIQVTYKKIPYDALRDFAPITLVVSMPNILVTHPSLPVKNVKELIALARARPGQLNYASAGIATSSHLSMELFRTMAGINVVHVPYKGVGPGAIDLVAGQVSLMMLNVLTAQPQLKNGKLRALGVTSGKRAVGLPDIPAIAEVGVPGYEATQWYGIFARAGTPREIVIRLNTEIVKILHLSEVRERLLSDGSEPVGNSPDEFGTFVKAELEKWANVVKNAGIKLE